MLGAGLYRFEAVRRKAGDEGRVASRGALRLSRRWVVSALAALGLWVSGASAAPRAVPLTDEDYLREGAAKGVVLLSVRWDRKWNCVGFENAQLRLLGFDLLPSARPPHDEEADLLLDDAPLLATKPRFDAYAFLVEPGQYGLSRLHIKVARSTSEVLIGKVGRDRLLKDGRPYGGTFTVGPGEVVYIGHFYIGCHREPTLWRYHIEDREGFDRYLREHKDKVPELDISRAKFRLFKSDYFGRDHELE